MHRLSPLLVITLLMTLKASYAQPAEPLPFIAVEGQPLAANIRRMEQAMEYLGAPLPQDVLARLTTAGEKRDTRELQAALDPLVLCAVNLNPESRVKVTRGPAKAVLQQAGYTPVLIKIVNESTSTAALHITCPQAGAPYAGVAKLTMERMQQTHLRDNENDSGRTDRFLEVAMFTAPPMTAGLSGLEVEYAIALIYSSEAGKREATLGFDIGSGTQDLGFRGEVPVLFEVVHAVQTRLDIKDTDGRPTTARLTFRDDRGHVYPPQARRLAPDFFFQKQIYRADGSTVLLPPGEFTMEASRGPEYHTLRTKITIPPAGKTTLPVRLSRWVNPAASGFYCGDHHIHAAGCAHYTSPSEGMGPEDMFQQVKGEGLNVGCILSWGYCFDYQRQFFHAGVHPVSEPLTLLKYDMEVSGFGSAAMGHVCLLNLHDLVYPGADGIKGWPTWTTPTLRWTKAQGGFTGYAHSAGGLQIDSKAAAARLISEGDIDKDHRLSSVEAQSILLPEPNDKIDADHDHALSEAELVASIERMADQLPNVVIPEMNGSGAMEIFVSATQGVCDFISAMDTARQLEWNCWYHLMNCGFPIKVSGETDFPCMSGTRVGQGRVYVQLGKVDKIDFKAWCEGLARGRSYVSDGYAHALAFTVNGQSSGGEVHLSEPGTVTIQAQVAFSSETPLEVEYGGALPVGGHRLIGDTVVQHETTGANPFTAARRKVELVVNGIAVAARDVPADDQVHDVTFTASITRSSWVALRQFPQLHTTPVNVLVANQPIRASRQSARWCLGCTEQLWRAREKNIAPAERDEARRTFETAKARYRQLIKESPEGS